MSTATTSSDGHTAAGGPKAALSVVIRQFSPSDQKAVVVGWCEGFDETFWQGAMFQWRSWKRVAAFGGAWAALCGSALVIAPSKCTVENVVAAAAVTGAGYGLSLPISYKWKCYKFRRFALPTIKDMADINQEWVQHPNRNFWVAEHPGLGIVGGIAVAIGADAVPGTQAASYPKKLTETDAVLFRMYTTRKARRKGVGSRLLQAAEAYCRERGCHRVSLGTANHAASLFYRRNGYTVAYEKFYPSYGTAYVLEKVLVDAPEQHGSKHSVVSHA